MTRKKSDQSARAESNPGQSPEQDTDIIHLSGGEGKTTLCGLTITEDTIVDVPQMGDSIHSESLVTCSTCKKIKQQEPIDSRIAGLNKLTPRHRAFQLFKVEVDGYSRSQTRFNPKDVMKKCIINAIRLVGLGTDRFDFSESKRSGALAVCVYAREAGRCHNCLRARHACLHPLGARLSPFGLAKMRRFGY